MRSFFALALILSTPLLAATSFFDPHEGEFTSPKTVALPSLHDRHSCVDAGGFWKLGACYFTTSDDVSIYNGPDGYDVTVSTVGTDAQSCHFESQGAIGEDGVLVATLATAVGPCDVLLRYSGTDWINVKSEGACATQCESEHVSLDIDRAKRTEISGP